MKEYAIYIYQGGYICKGGYTVQGESFKVLSTRIEKDTRIFKTKESAEKALEKLNGKYANIIGAKIVEVIRNE